MQHIRDGILVVNTETIAGKVITQNLGVVGGSTVRAKHIGKDIGALFKNIGGGELRRRERHLDVEQPPLLGHRHHDFWLVDRTK